MYKHLKTLAFVFLALNSLVVITFLLMVFSEKGSILFMACATFMTCVALFDIGLIVAFMKKQNPFKTLKNEPEINPVELSWNEWHDKYKPLKNTINPDPNNKYFFTIDENEVNFVKQYDNHNIWTLIEEDGDMYIIPGYHFANRIGYYITETPWTDEQVTVLY